MLYVYVENRNGESGSDAWGYRSDMNYIRGGAAPDPTSGRLDRRAVRRAAARLTVEGLPL